MIRWLVLLASLLVACGPEPEPRLDPVLVIMCGDVDPEEPPHPCCTAFALGGQVVTANHCVPGPTAMLVTRRQWTDTASASETGLVMARDESRDIAWLEAVLDSPGLMRGGPVAEGDAVSTLAMSGVKAGLAGERWESYRLSSMDVQVGDSGAAIVDAGGHAVGVLHACRTPFDAPQSCIPKTAIFAELP